MNETTPQTATLPPASRASTRTTDDSAVLRLAREALRAEPPAVRFVPRDLRLPQL
jgi:hypothetical protein